MTNDGRQRVLRVQKRALSIARQSRLVKCTRTVFGSEYFLQRFDLIRLPLCPRWLGHQRRNGNIRRYGRDLSARALLSRISRYYKGDNYDPR